MGRRRLMGTDLAVSVVCYGPTRTAQSADDPQLATHKRALNAAIERGVNFIYSSYEYGVRWMMHGGAEGPPGAARPAARH